MLYPIENRVREVKNLGGIWNFKIDRDNRGLEEKWYEAPLTDAVPMAVPSSYNDLMTDEKDKEHVGYVWYMDEEGHIRYAGVSNQTILHNLDYLYGAGFRIQLRCPVIPGINDTDAHIEGIAGLTEKYPDLEGMEIMPYHNMGKSKWRRIGRQYALPDLKTVGRSRKRFCLDVSREPV